MPVNTTSNAELVRLAIAGLDAQIKELEEKKAELARMTGGRVSAPKATVAAPVAKAPSVATAKKGKKGRKRGPMSPEAKAKLAAVAKKRWAAAKRAGKSKL